MRRRNQAGARRDRFQHRVLVGLDDDDARTGGVQRAGQAEVLLVGRDHLVLAGEPQAREHGRAATRRRLHERHPLGLDAEDRSECLARSLAQLEHLLDVLLAGSAFIEVTLRLRDERVDGRARKRPVRARVQIRVALEDRELRACLLVGHPTVSSTGA